MATPNRRGGWDLTDDDVAEVMSASFGHQDIEGPKRHEISAMLSDAEMSVTDFVAIRREQMRDEMLRVVGPVRNVRWVIRMEAEEA